MRRRLFTTMCGLVFLINFGRVAFAPLVPELQASLSLSPAAVGSVTSLVWLGSAVPRIPVGYLLTRVRRGPVVAATGVGLTAATAFTATANSLLALQVGAFAIGVATGGYFVAAIPLLGALYPSETGRRVGIHGFASQLAPVVAPAVVVGVVATLADWRLVFLALSVVAGLTTLVLLGVLRVGEPATDPPSRDFGLALARWRTILAALAFVAVAGFAWQGTFNFFVPYLTTKGFDEATANGLLTLVFAAGLPAFWIGGRLADQLPNVPLLLAINGAFAAGLFALTILETFLPVAAVVVFVGFVIHAVFPAVDTYVLATLPPEGRASAYAVFSGVALLLEANGSGVVGRLVEAGLAYDAAYRGLALAVAGLAVVSLLAYRAGLVPVPTRTAA